MRPPLVAITGANGAIGSVVAEELSKAGFEVRSLTRAAADVCDRDAIRRAIAGADCVVHLAAKLHIVEPTPSLREEYFRVNVGGTENVVFAAEAEGVKRLVHVSTIAVYGSNSGQLLTETSDARPDTIYGETKLASERIALGSNAAVLRFAAVYGSRVKGNYRRLLRAMSRGRFQRLGSGLNRRTLVYERDAARAVVAAATHAAAPGQVFNVTDGSLHSVQEILAAMAAALGRPMPRFALPVAPVRIAATIVEWAANLIGVIPPVTRATIEKYTEDVTVSGAKIQSLLGFSAEWNLEAGWSETVRIMRKRSEL